MTRMIDWGDGRYENTARSLLGATEVVVQRAGVGPGHRVLDLGCGTGNAALAAARRGAAVRAIDPAARLVEVARQRASDEGLSIDGVVGSAEALPFDDGAFDAVVSVFAVIFAADHERAASEVVRVLAPGGRGVIAAWTADGAIAEAGALLRQALQAVRPTPPGAPPPWWDPASVRALFAAKGAEVTTTEESIGFRADSAAAWFDEQAANHPVWRFSRGALAAVPGAWESLRERSIAALEAGNEEAGSFAVTSRYYVYVVERAER